MVIILSGNQTLHETRGDSKLLIQDLHVTIINATTGQILRDLTIDPTRDYQPQPPR